MRDLQNGEDLVSVLAEKALELTNDAKRPIRCIVFCDKREDAVRTKEEIERRARGDKKAGTQAAEIESELFVGGRRVFERQDAAKRLESLGFVAGKTVQRSRPAFLFATSAAEVGVDLDADCMVCDLVTWERMVQRLGRVNRRGDVPGGANVLFVVKPEPEPDKRTQEALSKKPPERDDKERKAVEKHEAAIATQRALRKPLELLCWNGSTADASTGAIRDLSERAERSPEVRQVLDAATTPAPLRPALTGAVVGAWATTSLESHPGRPEIGPSERSTVHRPCCREQNMSRRYNGCSDMPRKTAKPGQTRLKKRDLYTPAPVRARVVTRHIGGESNRRIAAEESINRETVGRILSQPEVVQMIVQYRSRLLAMVPKAISVYGQVLDSDDERVRAAAAREADVVVAVIGLTSELEGEEMPIGEDGFSGGDRTSIDLPKPEQELLDAVAASGKPLVVVLINGSALAVNWAQEHANAILEAWYPGEEGGTSVAQTLSGRNNPGGRLPVTFYKSVDQLPPFASYAMKDRTYRYFTGSPLYPFGYGLSYTTFAYSDLKVPAEPVAGGMVKAEAAVTNTGKLAGDEVVELYLSFPDIAGAPLKALRGFRRVHLAPGASEKVQFELQPRDLSMVTDAGKIIVPKGEFQLSVGGGQPDTGAPQVVGSFRVNVSATLPE